MLYIEHKKGIILDVELSAGLESQPDICINLVESLMSACITKNSAISFFGSSKYRYSKKAFRKMFY